MNVAANPNRERAGPDADEDLRQRVCRYLAHSVHFPLRAIEVAVKGGQVTLRGTAPTFYVRQLAIACAQRVAGVRAVIDEIQTEPPASQTSGPLPTGPKSRIASSGNV